MNKYPAVITNEFLMSQWDIEENMRDGLDPNVITLGSSKKVNWKHNFNGILHKWKGHVGRRFLRGDGCNHPECVKSKISANSANAKNFVGMKFGKLVVIKKSEVIFNRKELLWDCLCDCGNYHTVKSYNLRIGSVTSCGCMRYVRLVGQRLGDLKIISCSSEKEDSFATYVCECIICNKRYYKTYSALMQRKEQICIICSYQRDRSDLIGQRFGKLVILSFSNVYKSRKRYVLCQCDCGNTKDVLIVSLENDKTHSCGCNVGNVKYIINGKSLLSLCEENDVPYTSALNIYNNEGQTAIIDLFSRKYHRKITLLEKYGSQLLNTTHFNKKALEKHGYRPDFKLTDNLFVNVDGLFRHSESQREQKYHIKMREAYESEGKQIIQFYEDEVYNKYNIVKSIVNNALGKITNKIMARKCEFKRVDSLNAQLFFDNNHLMGFYKSARCIGLYINNTLVSALSYKIKKQKGYIEISRFGSLINTVVAGGFSKLLKELEKIARENNINKIISYCDLRYATGKSYEINGFKRTQVTLGWCWSNDDNRFNRLKCKATKYLTEAENAKIMKLYKIYDAGQAKYEKNIV